MIAELHQDARGQKAPEVEERVRGGEEEDGGGAKGGEDDASNSMAGGEPTVEQVGGNEQHARELDRRGGPEGRSRDDVSQGTRSDPAEGQEGQKHEGLEHDVRLHHVGGVHRDGRNGEQKRGRAGSHRSHEASSQHRDQEDARHPEPGHDRPRGQVRFGARRPVRADHGHPRGEKAEDETGVFVVAVVEAALGHHAVRVLDEDALVRVGTVMEAEAESGEAEGRGEDRDDRDGGPEARGSGHRFLRKSRHRSAQ